MKEVFDYINPLQQTDINPFDITQNSHEIKSRSGSHQVPSSLQHTAFVPDNASNTNNNYSYIGNRMNSLGMPSCDSVNYV